MRRLATHLTIVALVLSTVGVGVAWISGYRHITLVENESLVVQFKSGKDRFGFLIAANDWAPFAKINFDPCGDEIHSSGPLPIFIARKAFHFPAPDTHHYVAVAFSYWFIVASNLALVTWMVRRLRRPSILLQHTCQACGYDLRASPAACPECGRVPSEIAQAPAQ